MPHGIKKGISVARQGAREPAPLNRNVTNDKNSTKKTILFFQFQFVLVFSRRTVTCTTVINNNIDNQGARPPQFNFAKQFKCITWVKIRVVVLKIANSGPRLTFL